MEAKASKDHRDCNWIRAIESYNELLGIEDLKSEQAADYLLRRSECFLELGLLDAVVDDCRRIISIVKDSPDEVTESKARRRLVQALFDLRRFTEAELVIQEWISVKEGANQEEAQTMLEHLHILNDQKTNSETEDEEDDMDRFDDDLVVFSCTYCGITFKDKGELRAHCQTEEHQRVIMSDEGRDWQWRAPPRGLDTETYAICESWMENGVCRYGSQCIEAHGTDELKEWNERFEYRRMKMQRAYDTELYGKSYTEELIEKLIQTTIPDKIMKEHLPEVDCACSNKLATTISTKNIDQEWTFTLTSHLPLKASALLQDTHRNYFLISEILYGGQRQDISNSQEWIFKDPMPIELRTYVVNVVFRADIYGTFRQSVVFDFGVQPVLVKHLCVDVIPVTDIEKINEIRKEVVLSSNERWNNQNCDIIPFQSPLQSLIPSYGNMESDWAKHLSAAYPCPHADSFALSQATIVEKRLTKNNYRSRMHELLCIEEMARYERIAKFNVTAKLRIAHSYLLSPNSTASSTAKYSNSGELFALMNLGKDLSEDTSAGRLILTNCTTVLFAPENFAEEGNTKVFEALIEDKGKTTIYLRLSSVAVADMGLVSDQEIKCNVQFQLNRIPYCEWHYAIDKIQDFKIIFPETYLEPNVPWSPARQWSDTLDSRLNLKQKEAVVAITTPLYVHLPPVLIIGPFGTGKTYTLAQAIKQLMLQPENRILICTQSNSAADLYIKDYLHPYVESGHEEARPLRIYYHKRWVATVNQTVQKYCMIDSNGNSRNFRVPTVEDIMKHRIIVVTLSISMYLSTIELPRGFFTHIILDEAAQAMECEAIMPLALANQNTRIVLAGDHMQLSPELFSQFAKERNLHVSLLERLYDHYPTTFPCKILLSENYRAHEAIVQFTSESFYDQKLISSGKQPRHDTYFPLTFFTTRGEDVQDLNSTAFYNNSEVYEIVERVQELKKNWPSAWGKFDDQSVGIMTPYSDQVLRIRSELRKRRMYGISVERVLNVQGKQFRAIFLSTVRTRRTCTAKLSEDTDFGFLSNSKLLNTAITRAQSLVAVVGDPIALCSIGRCSKVWERFIQICEENRSLFGITWSSLKNQLDGVELKKTYVLNPLAPEFIPRKYQQEAFFKNGCVAQGGAFLNFPPVVRFVPPPFTSPPRDPKLKLAPRLFPVYNQMPPVFPLRPVIPQAPWMNISLPQSFVKEQQVTVAPPPMMLPPFNALQKPDDKSLIQFYNNVHFPEAPKLQNTCSLNEYINLLPPNTSLADMLQQPFVQQERWYYHLLETKGIEAARKFEFLIHATTKKEPDKMPVSTHPPSTSYLQSNVPNLNWYNKPLNQLNFDQPVYLKDFEQKFPAQPQPLYKRQSDSARHVTELHHVTEVRPVADMRAHEQQLRWQQQINADFANMSLGNGGADSVDDIFKQYNNSVSYASVVRTQSKPCEQPKVNNPVSNVRGEPSANGPRLYQYF